MSSSVDLVTMDDSSATVGDISSGKRRKTTTHESGSMTKRSKLIDMVFYDGKRHPAALLHELRPEMTVDSYVYQQEETASKQARFRCTVTVNNDPAESVVGVGFGRSKQSAKNMAAQQALINLYPTYRPPDDALLTEDCDVNQQGRFIPTLPPSVNNDPSLLIDSIRKHLTTKAIAIKTPLQLFNEIFIHNQRLNSSTTKNKNRIELIDNDENLFVVRVTAMDQQFWSVSVAKSVAQNEACQEAIETLCNVSFRNTKAEFVRALQSMNKITLPSVIMTDNNNNNEQEQQEQQQQEKPRAEPILLAGLSSSSFLLPNDEIDQI